MTKQKKDIKVIISDMKSIVFTILSVLENLSLLLMAKMKNSSKIAEPIVIKTPVIQTSI